MTTALRVAWFSAGVSSAVAVKLCIEEVDEIIYTHIEDQHPDTVRFVRDCEAWFGKSVTVLQSPLLCVENAVLQAGGSGYINGPHGAACTRLLKKRVRKEWEAQHSDSPLVYVWGLDCDEQDRAQRIVDAMPDKSHRFPLIEHRKTKAMAHEILKASGIKRPAMYGLGFHNNNCIGCVKGGMAYWNKIRNHFPDVFAARAALERRVGASCLKGMYLDELNPLAGRTMEPICDDCGIMCELVKL